ncbi:hypothetical protein ABN763_07505 [Spongiivirga sp. MCCC 1A20706]|uniref:hypothetical protein n=1 Tax=Spongiivirga sp. MCCC 1A20706 TaxID=3160963 RepID=UPI003977AEFB
MRLICLLFVCLSSCQQDFGQLQYITKLPDDLKENSGIALLNTDGLYWFIADSGNKDHLYGIDADGKIQRDINIKGAKNTDWEDLTSDENGSIYIGDFGNNSNKRKKLSIYIVPNPENNKKTNLEAEEIKFSFPEQKKFPPKAKDFLYDVEAFFYLDGQLYLFTRNRTSKKHFDGTSLVYRVPAKAGEYKAELLGRIKTCEQSKQCQITSAAIHTDTKKVVLLGYNKIWVIDSFDEKNIGSTNLQTISLDHFSQKEAICFLDETTLLISDEQYQLGGQNLYSFKLN